MKPIVPDSVTKIVTDKKLMTQPLMLFFESIVDMYMLSGIGPPEGVVQAVQKQTYLDESGIAGSVMYVKQLDDIAGDPKKGWILI